MKHLIKLNTYLFLVLFSVFCFYSKAQFTINTNTVATALASRIIGSCNTLISASLSSGSVAAGTFSYTGTHIGITSGILLTTGNAQDVSNPESFVCSLANGNNFSDPDLTGIVSNAKFDNCILEFVFQITNPYAQKFTINSIFGSEEYPVFVGSSFNDVLKIFISGPKPCGGNYVQQNISNVTINTYNAGSNSSQFIPNYNLGYNDISWGGYTTKIGNTFDVIPCETYTVKIAIADAGDASLDSGVLIEDANVTTCLQPSITIQTKNDTCGQGVGEVELVKPNDDCNHQYTLTWNVPGSVQATTTLTPGVGGTNSTKVKNITTNLHSGQVYSVDVTLQIINTTCNQSITTTHTFSVGEYIEAVNASFSVSAVCQQTASVFKDLSVTNTLGSTINNWQWDFYNNGSPNVANSNSSQNPAFTYSASGSYTAALIVTSSKGCKDTVRLPVDVWGHTIPDFLTDNVCYGTSSTFTNQTDFVTNDNVGGVLSYAWDFGDATPISNATNPTHNYTSGGNANATYNATLTSTSFHNCIDKVVKPVNVYGMPVASFSSDSVCLGFASHMSDASTGNGNSVTGYAWDFLSDGTIDAVTATPSFTFPAYGNNSVSYTVSSTPTIGLTCSNATYSAVWVNPNPTPDFIGVDKCINEQPISFNASGSTIVAGTNTAYNWSYGDSNTGSGMAVSHNYATASLYNVTLTVTSNKGCQGAISKQVEVYQKPLVIITNSNACDKKSMTFTATALPGSGYSVSWQWDYNNSIASIEAIGEVADNIFPAPGSQTVTLISETDKGCKDTLKKIVYIDYTPQPLFTVDRPVGCPLPHCVTFTDNTSPITGPGVNTVWKWVFGDGTTTIASSNSNQPHCYNNASSSQSALFNVKLIVTTDKGCTDSLEKTAFITVYPKPLAAYNTSPNPGNVVTPLVYFTNQSQDYTKSYWYFGDGSPVDSVGNDPTHFYSDVSADSYFSYLIVSNQYGCKDTAIVKVDIDPEFTFYIPNAFTPNEEKDGINDFFTGKGVGIENYEMWIYDRWGALVYYTDEIAKGWDGKVQGKSNIVQQDVYVWRVKIKDVLGKLHDYVGHVTLLK